MAAELGLDDVDAELVDAAEDGDVGAEVLEREVLDLLRHQAQAREQRLEYDVRVEEVHRPGLLRRDGVGGVCGRLRHHLLPLVLFVVGGVAGGGGGEILLLDGDGHL